MPNYSRLKVVYNNEYLIKETLKVHPCDENTEAWSRTDPTASRLCERALFKLLHQFNRAAL